MVRKILVPVDGSSRAEDALAYAIDEHPDSELTILHVINPTSTAAYSDWDDDYFDVEGYQRAEKRRREEAETMLEGYRERAEAAGVTAETVVKAGLPAPRILETAEEVGADHVVMGSRGRSGVGRVLFGSVAETVTRRSSVPVTIVR